VHLCCAQSLECLLTTVVGEVVSTTSDGLGCHWHLVSAVGNVDSQCLQSTAFSPSLGQI